MYCNCSNKENYEVVSLCDIKKFADKNGPFNNKAWVQISIADILMLDCNKLSIEKIEKIYITVSITNTKIIHTPISPNPNSEGMTLTGKKLLIDGFICSKIVYTSLTKEQTVYSSNFTVPFCTYVVIEQNADPFNDKYCVKTCIEDVFLSLIDCKTIFQNVTLFLLAEKISITCPNGEVPQEDCTIKIVPPGPDPGPDPPQPDPCEEPEIPTGVTPTITNIVKVKTTNGTELSQISFDVNTKEITVTSTNTSSTSDNIYPNNAYFLFKLRDCKNNIKRKALIKSKENANNFKTILENTVFKYGDFIEVELLLGRTAQITDFPSAPQTETLGKTAEIGTLIQNFYKITYNGLEAHTPNPQITTPILPNIININSVTSTVPIISMAFNKEDKMIVTTFRNEILDRSSDYTYISFKLSKPNGTVIAQVDFKSQQNVPLYIDPLIKLLFEYNDIIDLIYSPQAKSKVTITQFPSVNQNYNPTNNKEKYKITPTGLVLVNTPIPITTLPNTIILNAPDNSPVIDIQFDTTNNKIKVSSTGNITDSAGGTDYFKFTLYESDGKTEKVTYKIGGNMNGMDFSNKVSNTDFQSGDIVALAYKANDKVIITNFPNAQTPTYNPQGSEESFKITNAELTPYKPVIPPVPDLLASQQISFGNTATLAFDVNTKQLKVTSTGNVGYPNFKETKYFLFKLRDSSNNITKYSAIKADENATTFAQELNNTSFNFGDIIELTCFAINQITISNMPTQGNITPIEKVVFNSEARQGFFRIGNQGLQEYSPAMALPTATLPNTIKINTITNANCLAINFNTLDKVFQTFSFTTSADTTMYDYLIAKLYDKNNTLIITSTIPSNDGSRSIRTGLSTRIFDYDYILDLTYDYRARPNILVTNIKGKDHIPEHFNERYKITNAGLEFIPMFLTNIITINNTNDMPVAFIEFNVLEKTLKGTATSNIADSSSEYDYVVIKLYHLTDNALGAAFFTATLISNSNPITFTSNINTGYFIKDCILEISCNNNALNKVKISNFQTAGTTYTISTIKEYFKVTDNGLEKFTPTSILKDNIITISTFKSYIRVALTIKFDVNSKKIKATAINESIGTAHAGRESFRYTLKDKNGTIKKYNYVYGEALWVTSGSPLALANDLNDTPFEYGDSLELYAPSKLYTSVSRTRLFISNLPLNSIPIYSFFSDTETFTITPLGLVLQSNSPLGTTPILKNIIVLRNNISSGFSVLQIYFDIRSNKILVTSNDVFTEHRASNDYFIFTLKDKSNNEKAIARINGNIYGDKFATALNNSPFEYGDTISLQCPIAQKILISNYPNYLDNYYVKKQTENFVITKWGLESI